MDPKQIGNLGERIAERYLQKKGYRILEKNYFFRIPGNPQKGEIDIIAKKQNIICFVEVKTLGLRGRDALIAPEERVDWLKQRKIIKTAESWLMKNKIPLDVKWQIDVVSIRIDLENKKAKIRHFKNAVF